MSSRPNICLLKVLTICIFLVPSMPIVLFIIFLEKAIYRYISSIIMRTTQAPLCQGLFVIREMLLAQTGNYTDKKKRMVVARKFIEGASFNMVKNLKYYNNRGKDLEPIIEIIEGYRAKIDTTN